MLVYNEVVLYGMLVLTSNIKNRKLELCCIILYTIYVNSLVMSTSFFVIRVCLGYVWILPPCKNNFHKRRYNW